MKKTIPVILACGALLAALALAGCGGASDPQQADTPSQGGTAPAASTDEQPLTNPRLEGIYTSKVHEMESTRDDYIHSLTTDYKDWAPEMAEALNHWLDTDWELMSRTLGEIYDSGVTWLKETGEPEEDVQVYADRLAAVRDQCLAAVEQTIKDLRP